METPRPFRVATGNVEAASKRAWAEQARRVEALGYAVFLVADHVATVPFAPVPTLVTAADATTTLRVGCTVFANDYRHPALLAKEAATVDVLTDGRFQFCLGAGLVKAEHDQAGIPFDPPAVRVARLEEGLWVMKALRAGGPVQPGHLLHGRGLGRDSRAHPVPAPADLRRGRRQAVAFLRGDRSYGSVAGRRSLSLILRPLAPIAQP